MTDRIDSGLRDAIQAALDDGFSGDALKSARKQIENLVYELQSDLEFNIKDNAAANLSAWVVQMAENAVEQLLAGNEDRMRRYLSCEKRGEDGEYIGWTGRSDYKGWGRQRSDAEWHPVINGRIHEQGALELRKKIVDAHRDLLVNERIRDLEDQVKSLVSQVNAKEREIDGYRDRIRQHSYEGE